MCEKGESRVVFRLDSGMEQSQDSVAADGDTNHRLKGGKKCDGNDLSWPEEAGSASPPVLFVRRWTYSFMKRILRKGSRQKLADGTHLCQEDLFRVPKTMETAYLANKFRSTYAEKKGHLIETLWHLAAPTFVPAGFCQLLTVIAQVAIPLLVRELLRILEENPGEQVVREGLPYAILIFVASVTNAFGNHRQRHLATKTGVLIRAALVSVIYEHSLNLSPAGRAGLTSGEVTNLVAIDTQKLFEVAQEGHLIWSCPLSMIIVTVLLLLIMGPATIVGMFVLFLFVPVVKKIVSRMIAIRQKRIKVSDERCEILNAMLQGIKVTKLNNYESRYLKRVEETRDREMVLLRKELFLWAFTLVVTVTTPVIASAAAFTTYVLVSEDNILTPAKTFTVLLLFSSLRFPINYAGRLIGRAAQAIEACRRLAAFLSRETRSDRGTQQCSESAVMCGTEQAKDPSSDVLVVRNGTFQVGMVPGVLAINGPVKSSYDGFTERSESPSPWSCRGSSKYGFTLTNVNFSLARKQILAVVGPIGGGKSTLMNALIGDVSCSPETVLSLHGRVAYASQIPFILNATLRENILFGLPYDKERYEKVLDDCCLRPDIEQLGSAGDLTEIGERGVTLSGGQKQRVSLARVAYSQPDVAIFDDPLSALDAGTSRKIFDRLFRSMGNGLLSSSAVVLVTHASHFLHRVDKIMLVVDGKMAFLGSWNDLMSFEGDSNLTKSVVETIRSSVQEDTESVDANQDDSCTQDDADYATEDLAYERDTMMGKMEAFGELMTVETREHGLSSFRTWLVWFMHAGGLIFISLQVLLLFLDRFAYVATEWWLARWTEGHDKPIDVFGIDFPSQANGRSSQYKYLTVYALILLISFAATVSRSEWAVSGGARAAKNLFLIMTEKVIHAPMSYFETTPMGRILNRFTYDVEVLDLNLTQAMATVMIACSWFTAGICVMTIILPWIICALIPVTLMYGLIQLHYRKSGADLQRLDAVSRSPVQAMLAEGLDGASTIRAFRQEQNFLMRFQTTADTNSSAQLNFISAQRWIGLRIELLGALIVLVASLLVIFLNHVLGINPGLVALLLIWASNFTITLGFLVDHFTEAEAAITSIERIHSMLDLPQENGMITSDENRVDPSWPTRGALEFENVCLRYRDGLPLALNGLSFKIEPGMRCGVVGRTGAGKSSLTVALFRLVEIESGRIVLDGVDLSKLGLSDVRGRPNGMSIIPQDPVLFAGTLRECLDPFGLSADETILDALQSVRLAGSDRGLAVLEDRVEEGGANYSVGERQLLCLARAILAKPKVLVMDEATASVDRETDAFIQKMLRTRFKETTLLTIAHRLDTVMDYDQILVMDGGKAVEFDTPRSLLENESGVFTQLVNSTGKESAASLKAVAN